MGMSWACNGDAFGNFNVSLKYAILSFISDFGLCRPAYEESSANKTVFGVLPFVAPEVLQGGLYTKAADVYGFGMVMYEIIAGEPPFIDREYDQYLALSICKGERPPIPQYVPELYVTTMKRCWDAIPVNRPTAKDLFYQFKDLDVLDEEEFSEEREQKWKENLATIQENPRLMKQTHNFYTSKHRDYFDYLTRQLRRETNEDDESTLIDITFLFE